MPSLSDERNPSNGRICFKKYFFKNLTFWLNGKKHSDDSSLEIKSFDSKKCFYKKWVFFFFFLFPKADYIIFAASLF